MPNYHCYATLKTASNSEGDFDGVVYSQEPVTSHEALEVVRQTIKEKFAAQKVTSVTIRSITRLD